MTIDYTGAPEGATHGRIVTGTVPDFYRLTGNKFEYWSPRRGLWLEASTPVEICEKRPNYWSGKDLPSAGDILELCCKGGGWGRAEIKYLSDDVCVWLWLRPDALVRQIEHGAELRHMTFRKIMTPGERAKADERADVGEQIGSLLAGFYGYEDATKSHRQVGEYLYDNGLRMVTP